MSVLLAAAAVALSPAPAHRHHYPHVVYGATAYSPCSSGSVMADGQPTHAGAVASNTLRLGTRIEISRPVFGRRRFKVEDTGSAAMQMDFWTGSCSGAIDFGRRVIHYRLLPR